MYPSPQSEAHNSAKSDRFIPSISWQWPSILQWCTSITVMNVAAQNFVLPDLPLGPDNPRIRYVGNLFQITWWQHLFVVTRCVIESQLYHGSVCLSRTWRKKNPSPRIGITLLCACSCINPLETMRKTTLFKDPVRTAL